MIKKIGIIGLGVVGEATLKSIQHYSSLISKRTGLKIKVKTVCDLRSNKKGVADKFGVTFTKNARDIIDDPEIDTVVELIGGKEPARTFIKDSLKNGKNIVTANKALLAEYGRDIFFLAKKENKRVGFEASVCGAIPLIKTIEHSLAGCDVSAIYGILNGTTNYILSQMLKERLDFSQALKAAQEKGFAEANPSLDINGLDALHKLAILSYLCFGYWPSLSKIYRQGISNISLFDVLYAQDLQYRIKLLAIAKKRKNNIELRVHPTFVPLGHPLADVSGSYNAVYFHTHPAGELLFYGQGAGGTPTSSSVVSDIISISLTEKNIPRREVNLCLKSFNEIKSRYYIRCMTADKPGVLASIARILSSYEISIASVNQKKDNQDRFVPIVMVTHQAREDYIFEAMKKIDSLKSVKSPSQVIRIEDF
ncbi:MAG: homoserine dehydrogenase [Candidatus Omnitrophica bacterium]|nr:homoserine dehydrogenase [Candidatus Omnitrophota bacterium]